MVVIVQSRPAALVWQMKTTQAALTFAFLKEDNVNKFLFFCN